MFQFSLPALNIWYLTASPRCDESTVSPLITFLGLSRVRPPSSWRKTDIRSTTEVCPVSLLPCQVTDSFTFSSAPQEFSVKLFNLSRVVGSYLSIQYSCCQAGQIKYAEMTEAVSFHFIRISRREDLNPSRGRRCLLFQHKLRGGTYWFILQDDDRNQMF